MFLKRRLSQFQISALIFVLCGILISNTTNLQNLSNGSLAIGEDASLTKKGLLFGFRCFCLPLPSLAAL
jgi:hypothetical protein